MSIIAIIVMLVILFMLTVNLMVVGIAIAADR
jgi:hypothetical protein